MIKTINIDACFEYIPTTLKEKIDDIIQNYFYRQVENLHRYTIENFVKKYGDSTDGLWSQIENLQVQLIISLENALKLNDNELYANFIKENMEQFLKQDLNYRKSNKKYFEIQMCFTPLNEKDFDEETFGKSKVTLKSYVTEHFFSNEDDIKLKSIGYFLPIYGESACELFEKFELFNSEILHAYTDAVMIKDNYQYAKFIINNIQLFLKRDNDFKIQ